MVSPNSISTPSPTVIIKCHQVDNNNNKKCSEQQCFSCPHCSLPLCCKHLVSHQNLLKTQIKQLTTETNRVLKTTNLQTSPALFERQRNCFYQIVEEWKTDRIDHILFIYQKKLNQIDLITYQTRHELEKFKIEQKTVFNAAIAAKLEKLLFTNQQTPANEIEELNQKLTITRNLLDYFVQPSPTLSTIPPALSSIVIERVIANGLHTDEMESDEEYVDFSRLFKLKPIREFQLETDNLAMASSDSNVLVRDGSKLLLFDSTQKLHETVWKQEHLGDFIRDISWCQKLNLYLVLSQYILFTFDPCTYELTRIVQVKPIERLKFSSLTCYDQTMFLVNGNGQFVEKWTLEPSWQLLQRWPEHEYCEENFRLTSRIRSHSFILALNICDSNFGYRLCLYDYSMKLIRRIKSDFNLHLLSHVSGCQWLATDYKEKFYVFNDDEDDEKMKAIDYKKGGYIRNVGKMGNGYVAVKIINRLQFYKY